LVERRKIQVETGFLSPRAQRPVTDYQLLITNPRLLGMGLSAEQVAEALSLSVEEVTENAEE